MIGTKFHYQPSTDSLLVERVQDVEPILEFNKKLYTEDNGGWSPSRDLRRVASIPNVVVEQWLKEGINIFDKNDWNKVKRRLNDSEWQHLRTAPGVI